MTQLASRWRKVPKCIIYRVFQGQRRLLNEIHCDLILLDQLPTVFTSNLTVTPQIPSTNTAKLDHGYRAFRGRHRQHLRHFWRWTRGCDPILEGQSNGTQRGTRQLWLTCEEQRPKTTMSKELLMPYLTMKTSAAQRFAQPIVVMVNRQTDYNSKQ